MKRQIFKLSFLMVLSGTMFLASCKKDDPQPDTNEEEVITTMQLVFVPQGGGTTVTYKFDDPDGPGGTAPTQDVIQLQASKVYDVSIQLLNKTVTPAEDITVEVAEESDAHRFYFEPSAASNITVNGLNNDINGIPLGITSVWTTGAAGVGTNKITLRHYPGTPPNKAAGDPVNSTKSGTDIEVEFSTAVN
jgi:hypothetical protein